MSTKIDKIKSYVSKRHGLCPFIVPRFARFVAAFLTLFSLVQALSCQTLLQTLHRSFAPAFCFARLIAGFGGFLCFHVFRCSLNSPPLKVCYWCNVNLCAWVRLIVKNPAAVMTFDNRVIVICQQASFDHNIVNRFKHIR